MPTSYQAPETGCRAVVHLTLEITVSSGWGGDCSLDQVFKQAREEAVGKINTALAAGRETLRNEIKIVGTPLIQSVITERKS